MLAAIILAAGESRRMGHPKALLDCGGRSFLERLLAVTNHPRIGLQRVVLGAHAALIQQRLGLPLDLILINPEWSRGQLSSLRVALTALQSLPTEGALVAPVDHPLVQPATVARLVEAFDAHPDAIVVPRYGRRRGHPVIFSRRFYTALCEAPEDRGARAVVWSHPDSVIETDVDDAGVLADIDDPETYTRWVKVFP